MDLSSSNDNIPKIVEDMIPKNDIILVPSQPSEKILKFLSAFQHGRMTGAVSLFCRVMKKNFVYHIGLDALGAVGRGI